MIEKSFSGRVTAKSCVGFGRLKEGKRVDLPKLPLHVYVLLNLLLPNNMYVLSCFPEKAHDTCIR